MNSLEIKAAFHDVSGKRVANVFEFKELPNTSNEQAGIADKYSSANASDAVAAKVLSFSIGQRFDSALNGDSIKPTLKPSKLQVIDGGNIFNIDKVVDNVLGFVTGALTKLSKNGASIDDISYFKQQAIDGVNFGVEQAKAELASVSDDRLTKNIEDSRAKILEGIDRLPDNPVEYPNKPGSLSTEMNEFTIKSKSGKPVDISFGPKAFLSESNEQGQKQLFTSQASNLSFSISGSLMNDEIIAFADVVNRVDDLANTFYRKDIEGLYSKASAIGYDDTTLLNLSLQKAGTRDNKNITNTYQDIQHLNKNSKLEDLSSPKAVADYLSRLMNVMETSERELASVEDYNQVINGLVNQMKDVQVPDLLQAINRFHAFNTKFINIK